MTVCQPPTKRTRLMLHQGPADPWLADQSVALFGGRRPLRQAEVVPIGQRAARPRRVSSGPIDRESDKWGQIILCSLKLGRLPHQVFAASYAMVVSRYAPSRSRWRYIRKLGDAWTIFGSLGRPDTTAAAMVSRTLSLWLDTIMGVSMPNVARRRGPTARSANAIRCGGGRRLERPPQNACRGSGHTAWQGSTDPYFRARSFDLV
jgi:hypothetical protein